MGLLQDIQKKIKAKEFEVSEIQGQIRSLELRLEAAKAYISGLQEILPRVQKGEPSNGTGDGKAVEFRKGSAPEIAREILDKEGAPMHVNQILQKMGKFGDKKAKLALVGTLSRYARQGIVFKKTAPNTFSLIEIDATKTKRGEDDLPEDFGKQKAA